MGLFAEGVGKKQIFARIATYLYSEVGSVMNGDRTRELLHFYASLILVFFFSPPHEVGSKHDEKVPR